jgi:hypothetical protein
VLSAIVEVITILVNSKALARACVVLELAQVRDWQSQLLGGYRVPSMVVRGLNFEFAPLLHEHLLYNLVVDVSRANVCTIIAICRHIVGMTFRDRNDKRVFIQNLRSWYLMSGSEQTRIWSMSLQIVPHCFERILGRNLSDPPGCLQRRGH